MIAKPSWLVLPAVLALARVAAAQSGAPLDLVAGPTGPEAGPAVPVAGGAAYASGNLIAAVSLLKWSSCSGLAAELTLYYDSAAALHCASDSASLQGFGCGVTGPGARARINGDGTITIREPNLEQRTFALSGSVYVRAASEQNRFDFDTITATYSGGAVVALTERAHDGRWRRFSDLDQDGVTFVETGFGDRTADFIELDYSSDERRLTRLSDAQGRQATFTTDTTQGAPLITGITGPEGESFALTYVQNTDNLFDLSSLQSPGYSAGTTSLTTYQVDGQHLLQSLTSPALGTITYTFDTNGRLSSVVDRMGLPLAFTYYSDQYSVTDGYFREHTYKLIHGLMVQEMAPNGLMTSYVYDSLERLVTVVTPLGDATRVSYSAADDLTKIQDVSLNRSTTYTYNGTHDQLSMTDYLGNVTQMTRNNYGQPLTIVDPAGVTTTIVYDANGAATSVTSDGRTRTFANNAYGLPISVTEPDGRNTKYVYDAYCNVSQVTLPCPDGTIQRTSTPTGYLQSVTDPRGVTTQYAYNDAHQITSVSNSLGQSTTFSFGADGNPTEINDRGDDWTGSWDPATGLLASAAQNGVSVVDSGPSVPSQPIPPPASCSMDCTGFCGSLPLCGQTTDCGTCASGWTCNANNQCVLP